MRPRGRNILAYLVHTSQNNIILDREQFQVSDLLQCHWSCNFGKLLFFLFYTNIGLKFGLLVTISIKLFIYANEAL